MNDFDLLDLLDETPNGAHTVVIFPSRGELRRKFQPFVGQRDPIYRTHTLHRAEYLEDRTRGARLYLRTPKQITAANRNRAIDGAVRAYVAPGVTFSYLMETCLKKSGIPHIIPATEAGLL